MQLKMNDRKRQARAGRAEHGRKGQAGIVLLEALIAILVFSLGILTVIGIQAMSIKMAGEAQWRTRAALLADRLVGEMWTSGFDIASLKMNFESPNGDAYRKWLEDVRNVSNSGLPGVDAVEEPEAGESEAGESELSTATMPTVRVNDAAGADFGLVVITLYWRTSPTDQLHQHTVTSQIVRNP
jgi:type IV pilus assembly protein PilV